MGLWLMNKSRVQHQDTKHGIAQAERASEIAASVAAGMGRQPFANYVRSIAYASSNGMRQQQVIEQRIRQRTYEIWESLGRPDGDSDQHWLKAERELLTSSMVNVTAKKTSTPRKTPRQAKLACPRAKDGCGLTSSVSNGTKRP